MNERVKKILRNVLFLLSVPVIIWAFVFARVSSLNDVYRGAKVEITNPELSFVSSEEVMNMIEEQGLLPDRMKVKEMDIAGLKSAIEKNPWVRDVKLFLSSKQILHVYLTQRVPALRWELKGSLPQSYYLDEEANPMPLHDDFLADVPVVTGALMGNKLDDLNYKTSLVHLADYIQQDSFWNASIAQIDITENTEIVLIPVLGKHMIRFGKPDDIIDKMKRLYTFYQQGIKNIDWSLYDELDARYQGQVICRNSKGLILTEDPYESHEDEMERLRVKKEIDQEELRIQQQKELMEKQKAIEKERMEKLKALEKERIEKQMTLEKERIEKQRALEKLKAEKLATKEKLLHEKEEAKRKAHEAKSKADANKAEQKQQKNSNTINQNSHNVLPHK